MSGSHRGPIVGTACELNVSSASCLWAAHCPAPKRDFLPCTAVYLRDLLVLSGRETDRVQAAHGTCPRTRGWEAIGGHGSFFNGFRFFF